MSTETRRIDKYELREHLGQDQMAETWKAYDDQAQRFVVLKILHEHLHKDPYFFIRFEREAKEIKALHHPHLLQVQDMQICNPPGSQRATAYIVMEYVEGQNLADYLRSTSYQRRFPSIADIIYIFDSIGSAIDYAHQKGIKYCNVRSSSILLERQSSTQRSIGKPLLINYEVSTLLGDNIQAGSKPQAYSPPEQARGVPGDERSDIYQLGVILYETCTGALPFQGESPGSNVKEERQSSRTITPPEAYNPRVSPALSQVIMRCLAEDPRARFSSASALVSALKDAFNVSGAQPAASVPASTTPPSEKKKHNTLLIALAALLILAVIGSGLSVLFAKLNKPVGPVAVAQISGHAYLESSGQITDTSPGGLNDELQLVLSNIPSPAPNKSYYLWLLSDAATKPTRSIALGTVPVDHGTVNRLYTTPQHTNLIAYTSRLLITEENTQPAPQQFSSDQRTWRYYAEIPQRTPSPGAPKLGAIRYLRFLIFESNKMIAQGIHGGSVTLVLRNTQKVLEWAGSARDDWALQNFDLIHRHFIRILDYIDGSAFVDCDLPPGTPLLVNPLLAQNGLVTIVPGENPEAYPPRAAFSILSFIQASPNLSPEKRQLGLEAEKDIRVNIAYRLQQVRLYAKQLVAMSNTQLAQKSTVPLLDSMLEQARIAYSGSYDPTVNRFLGGALNDYNSIQFLASYDIASYRQG
jgi:serine/threonine protein kinase